MSAPEQSKPRDLKPRGSKTLLGVAFAALGFTTSTMNSLTVTPGATQSYLPLIFAFVGGSALVYAGATNGSSQLTWPAVEVASLSVLALCCGVLLGLPAGIGVRFWAAAATQPHRAAESTSVSAIENSRDIADIALHAEGVCQTAARVLQRNQGWLSQSNEGTVIAVQYGILMERAGCRLPP